MPKRIAKQRVLLEGNAVRVVEAVIRDDDEVIASFVASRGMDPLLTTLIMIIISPIATISFGLTIGLLCALTLALLPEFLKRPYLVTLTRKFVIFHRVGKFDSELKGMTLTVP